MCEACGPANGKLKPVNPKLMALFKTRNEAEARRRGLTRDEFLKADALVKPRHRFRSWLEGAWINLQLLKPGL